MLTFVRAGIAAVLVMLSPVLASVPAASAEKAFQRDDLADAAIKLEAKINSDAGQVSKSAATLRREADAAFGRNDFRTGLQILGQIVVAARTVEEPARCAMDDGVESGGGLVGRRGHPHAVPGINANRDGLQPSPALDHVRNHGIAEADLGALHD